VNGNDLQPRITSAIQSGAGPDIVMLFNNHPQIYSESVVDLSELTSSVSKAEGGYYDLCKSNTVDGQKSIAMPWTIVGAMIAYRKSWFDEIGSPTFPDTWEKYREVGKKLKAKGRPIGQTLGHTFGDAPTFSYPYLWSWGGKEVDEKGKVVLNSKETIESVKFMQAFWKDSFDEGGLAWDDTNNNRAFLSGSISATNNGASIYIEAKKKPDSYLTETGRPMKDDILHAGIPAGPGGQFNLPGPFTDMLMSYSQNQKPAKDFMRWIRSKPVFDEWFTSQQGYTAGATKVWEEHPVWNLDPVLAPFKKIPVTGRLAGYAGPPSRKAAEVTTKYIIVDMYAKAIQGMPAEDAVKAAHAELVKIYT
jgi:ABC-type glycerol-3-phosphate transport system substrate-binding protein